MISDQYPNYYKAFEIYTEYFDSLYITIFFFYPSSIVITRDLSSLEYIFWKHTNGRVLSREHLYTSVMAFPLILHPLITLRFYTEVQITVVYTAYLLDSAKRLSSMILSRSETISSYPGRNTNTAPEAHKMATSILMLDNIIPIKQGRIHSE